ncbi:MAG: membrane protein insertion efficiency factor YidD [Salinarimonas sp.]|nr:membrane protein insertion efficiency factor YidD [Salinarimonas sp.]
MSEPGKDPQRPDDGATLDALFDRSARAASRAPASAARGLITVYRYSLSGLIGRQCRHLPSCSEYTHEAIGQYGLWRGGWMGLARICRCGPGGTHGIDNVPDALPAQARWYMPWRYGLWRSTNAPSEPMRAQSTDDG